jgi:hypothetical protein
MMRWDPTFIEKREAAKANLPPDEGVAHRALADIRWSIEGEYALAQRRTCSLWRRAAVLQGELLQALMLPALYIRDQRVAAQHVDIRVLASDP